MKRKNTLSFIQTFSIQEQRKKADEDRSQKNILKSVFYPALFYFSSLSIPTLGRMGKLTQGHWIIKLIYYSTKNIGRELWK